MTALAQTARIAPATAGHPAPASRRMLPAWAPLASLLLHGAVLGATLVLLQRPPPPAAPGETGVEFLWDQAAEASLATGEVTESPGQPVTVEGPPPPEPAMAQAPPPVAASAPPDPMAATPPPPAPPVPPPDAPAPPREAALPPPDPAASSPPVAPPPPAPSSLALDLLPVPPDAPAPVALPPPAPAAAAEPETAEALPLPPPAPAAGAEPETAEALPLPPPMPSPPPARPAPARQALAQAAPPAQAPGPPPMAATPGAGAQASIAGGSQALGRVSPPGLLDGARNPEPEYPYLSRQRGEQGTVSVLLRISEAGRVLEVELLRSSGHPTLDEAAKRAALLSRFRPAMRDYVPVPGTIRTSYHFRLDR